MEELQFKDIVNGERSRTYVFPGGGKVRIDDAVKLCVRPSGSHRVETADGRKFIVVAGWIALEVDADAWSL